MSHLNQPRSASFRGCIVLAYIYWYHYCGLSVCPSHPNKVAGPAPSYADVAQLVEQRFRKAKVVGSIPTIGSMILQTSVLENF